MDAARDAMTPNPRCKAENPADSRAAPTLHAPARMSSSPLAVALGLALAVGLAAPGARALAGAPAVRLVRDVAYGADPKQRFDVYVPRGARNAPVILMVHGGGWRIGDKRSRGVVGNKVRRWSREGIVVISVNYRLLPGTDPVEQARDVARALPRRRRGCPNGAATRRRSC